MCNLGFRVFTFSSVVLFANNTLRDGCFDAQN